MKDRPNIRPIEIGDETGYGKDMGVLWAAYKAGNFEWFGEMEQEDFAQAIIYELSRFDSLWIVEDKNSAFSSGKGPVAIYGVHAKSFTIEPHVIHFKWASKRNIVRTVLSFFQMVRYSKDVACCVVIGTPETVAFFRRIREFGILLWHIGNDIFCLAGRKQCLGHR